MRRPITAVRRVFRDLSGRTDASLMSGILQQLDVTSQGAELTVSAVRGEVDSARARTLMGDLEHNGDRAREAVVDRLATSLSTPIDREDLFRLSRAVDDILDTLRDFIREMDLLQVVELDVLLEPTQAIVEAVRDLTEAVQTVGEAPRRVPIAALKAKKNTISQMYQAALQELLSRELRTETLKVSELLRQLDHVGLRLDDAANALSDGVVKRGQ